MTNFDRKDLETFMRSFLLEPGQDMNEFLRWSDRYMNSQADDQKPPKVVEIDSVNGWDLRLSIWGHEDGKLKPVIYHVHGGAWIAGTHLSHRGLSVELADCGFIVVGIDYRRAPKHRFPAGLEDAAAGLNWVKNHIKDFGGDAEQIVLLGDSAGANLAAALAAVPNAYDSLRAVAFLYGVFDFASALPVVGRIMGKHPETQLYLPTEDYEDLVTDPRVSPLKISLWPVPVYLGIGTGDPLLEQSRMMRDRLANLGAKFEYHEFEDAPHSYVQIVGSEHYIAGIDSVVSFFRSHLT